MLAFPGQPAWPGVCFSEGNWGKRKFAAERGSKCSVIMTLCDTMRHPRVQPKRSKGEQRLSVGGRVCVCVGVSC